MAKPLKVIHWNARGLKSKTATLRPLLQELDIDVALISETHLGPADKIRFPGFLAYRRDETQENGRSYRGLAVLVKRRVVHQPLPLTPFNTVYTLGVAVHQNGTETHLYAAYKPPGNRLEVGDIQVLLDVPQATIIAGDMNCKHPAWNSTIRSRDGARLYNAAEARGYTVAGPEVPTHYPDYHLFTPDVLDITITNANMDCQITQEVLDDELLSDHQPVLVVLHAATTRIIPPAPRPQLDWTKFTETMETTTRMRVITSAADVEEAAAELTAAIQSAMRSAEKNTNPTQGRCPSLPAHIRRLIADKRRLRRTWQNSRCPRLKAVLNRLAERVRSELRALATERWESYIDTMEGDWPSIHKLCRQLKNTPAPVRPLQHPDGTPRYKAEDRATIFADHLAEQFSPNPTAEDQHVAAVEQHLRDYFEAPIAPEEDPIFFSPGMVHRVIRRTKPRKAPGLDGITNTALRRLPHKSVAALARLFTGILRTGAFPNQWKEGKIILLPKQGKNVLKPESYRPITLLPTISKVFEQLLLRYLTPYITPRPEQFGFRSEHSTTLQLSRVLHLVCAARNKREHAVAVFLDMEKAFDRVWHDGLVYKLSRTSAPRRILKVVSSFLQDRTFRVAVENALSSPRTISAGVPQGSCLSPVLYAWFTDDIPVADGSQLALYADDAAYLTTSLSAAHAAVKMQRSLDLLPAWLSRWRLSVNVSKTQAIAISPARKLPPPLILLDTPIPWTSSAKYLGVIIDRGLTMTPHVRSIVAQVRATRALLRPVLRSRLPHRVKLGVYKAYIRTRLTYAAPAWFALTSESSRKALRAQQSLTLRTIVDAPRYVRNEVIARDLRIESLDDFVRRLATSMFERADASAWDHVRDLAPWHARPPDRHNLPRDLLADTSATTGI